MISIQGEDTKPSLWVSASLSHFGINPYGEPIFRVVWAPSRMQIIGAAHRQKDGTEWIGYKWYPRYMGKNCYLLERWLSPIQYAGTPATYEATNKDEATGLMVTGPYPARGEYQDIWEFPPGYPAVSAVEEVIRWALYGQNYTYAQKRELMLAEQKKASLDVRNRNADLIVESMPVGGFSQTNLRPGRGKKNKRAEDYPQKYSAKDLGMPVGNNKSFTRNKPL